ARKGCTRKPFRSPKTSKLHLPTSIPRLKNGWKKPSGFGKRLSGNFAAVIVTIPVHRIMSSPRETLHEYGDDGIAVSEHFRPRVPLAGDHRKVQSELLALLRRIWAVGSRLWCHAV